MLGISSFLNKKKGLAVFGVVSAGGFGATCGGRISGEKEETGAAQVVFAASDGSLGGGCEVGGRFAASAARAAAADGVAAVWGVEVGLAAKLVGGLMLAELSKDSRCGSA